KSTKTKSCGSSYAALYCLEDEPLYYASGRLRSSYATCLRSNSQKNSDTHKAALEIALNKGDFQKRAAFKKMRDNDLAGLIFSNHNKDAYIIAIRGLAHVDLVDLLTNQGLGVNNYISAKALRYMKESLSLDSLKPFLSRSVKRSI
ncbi:MAG: hypothetical protein KKD90_06945, partial [Candidatus Omnitrophica bacterium]|nr:hypothetical protein [Candidatus Omnitrophota bacterium]